MRNVIIDIVDSKYESKENNGAWVKSKRSEQDHVMMSESLNTNEFSFLFCFVWRCFKVLSELVGRHNTTQRKF